MILNLEDVVDQLYSAYWADQGKAYVEVLKAIEKRKPCPSAEEWDRCWSEHEQPTEPKFLKRTNVFRWLGRFVTAPVDAEVRFFTELKRRLFKEWLSDVEALAEFGCGTGHNLKQYGEMFPGKKLYAYDWAPSTEQLAARVGASWYQFNMKTARFCGSREGHTPPRGCGILTCGSMEQMGDDFKPFLNYVRGVDPKVCIHVEPCVELYDESKLFDLTAAMYHRSRGYLGLWIAEVEKLGEVLLKERTGFGNLFNEGYSVVVWRPR